MVIKKSFQGIIISICWGLWKTAKKWWAHVLSSKMVWEWVKCTKDSLREKKRAQPKVGGDETRMNQWQLLPMLMIIMSQKREEIPILLCPILSASMATSNLFVPLLMVFRISLLLIVWTRKSPTRRRYSSSAPWIHEKQEATHVLQDVTRNNERGLEFCSSHWNL